MLDLWEQNPKFNNDAAVCVEKIYKKDGIRGFFKGVSEAILCDIVYKLL